MCDSAGGGTALVVNSICTLIGGLGGAALGAWWVSRNSEKLAQAAHDKALTLINKTHEKDIILMKQQEFSKAAAELRLSFSKIISGIRAGKLPTESDIRGFAQTSYDTHAIEIERFRSYIPDNEKENYDKAWEEYSHMIYMRPINHGSPLSPDELYIGKVNKILEFAKP